ncbi:MAG TPA: BON domain-containing protein [Albitalea sp.]|nr:BON domain-containing protein [Albitalea sp.]
MTTIPALAALVAALALAGCNKQGAGQQTGAAPGGDTNVAQNDQKSSDQGSAMDKMAQATKNAADTAGDKVNDAVITTSVNAELAKDPGLSALHINVDTANGSVALHGTVPDAAARDRAAALAQGVKGVKTVENQLTVEGKK